jgi:hypothetical protein
MATFSRGHPAFVDSILPGELHNDANETGKPIEVMVIEQQIPDPSWPGTSTAKPDEVPAFPRRGGCANKKKLRSILVRADEAVGNDAKLPCR